MSGPVESVRPPSHLTVTVLRAVGLRAKNLHGGSNPYVTLQLGKQKLATPVLCDTLEPQWNSTLTFPLTSPLDSVMVMTLTVMHKRSLLPLADKFLGRVEFRLGDVCKDKQIGLKKWFALRSKPKKKAKRRGRIEVSFRLSAEPSNSHSHTKAHTQPSSICANAHIIWESSEQCSPSSVQTVVGRCEPIQPSCAANSGLDAVLPSVPADTHVRAASPECVSISGVCDSPRPASNESAPHGQEAGECLLRTGCAGVTIATQTSSCPAFTFTLPQRSGPCLRSGLRRLRSRWEMGVESGENGESGISPSESSRLLHALRPSYSRFRDTSEKTAEKVAFESPKGFFGQLSLCFGGG